MKVTTFVYLLACYDVPPFVGRENYQKITPPAQGIVEGRVRLLRTINTARCPLPEPRYLVCTVPTTLAERFQAETVVDY